MLTASRHVQFIERMLLLRTEKLPEGSRQLHELKFDGYRAVAIKSRGMVYLRPRNNNDFNGQYRRWQQLFDAG